MRRALGALAKAIAVLLASLFVLIIVGLVGMFLWLLLSTAWKESVAPIHGWFWLVLSFITVVVGGAISISYLMSVPE